MIITYPSFYCPWNEIYFQKINGKQENVWFTIQAMHCLILVVLISRAFLSCFDYQMMIESSVRTQMLLVNLGKYWILVTVSFTVVLLLTDDSIPAISCTQ